MLVIGIIGSVIGMLISILLLVVALEDTTRHLSLIVFGIILMVFYLVSTALYINEPSDNDVFRYNAYYKGITHICDGDTIKTYKIEYINK